MVNSSSWKEVLCKLPMEIFAVFKRSEQPCFCVSIAQNLKICGQMPSKNYCAGPVLSLLVSIKPVFPTLVTCTQPLLLPFLHTASTIPKAVFFFKLTNFCYLDLFFKNCSNMYGILLYISLMYN